MVVYLVRFKEIIADVVISFVVNMWLKFNMHVALYLVCRKQTEEVLEGLSEDLFNFAQFFLEVAVCAQNQIDLNIFDTPE